MNQLGNMNQLGPTGLGPTGIGGGGGFNGRAANNFGLTGKEFPVNHQILFFMNFFKNRHRRHWNGDGSTK